MGIARLCGFLFIEALATHHVGVSETRGTFFVCLSLRHTVTSLGSGPAPLCADQCGASAESRFCASLIRSGRLVLYLLGVLLRFGGLWVPDALKPTPNPVDLEPYKPQTL